MGSDLTEREGAAIGVGRGGGNIELLLIGAAIGVDWLTGI